MSRTGTTDTASTSNGTSTLSLLKLLPGAGSDIGPSASELVTHVLSHEHFDSAANAHAPRETFHGVTVDDAISDEYIFPLGRTGQSIVLTGYRIAAGFIAERAADEWLNRAAECAQRILDPVANASIVSLFETYYRGRREFLRMTWEGLLEDLVPESRRPLAGGGAAQGKARLRNGPTAGVPENDRVVRVHHDLSPRISASG